MVTVQKVMEKNKKKIKKNNKIILLLKKIMKINKKKNKKISLNITLINRLMIIKMFIKI